MPEPPNGEADARGVEHINAFAASTSRVRLGQMCTVHGAQPQPGLPREGRRRRRTSSPAAASRWASAPAGTSTSGARTATASPPRASGSRCSTGRADLQADVDERHRDPARAALPRRRRPCSPRCPCRSTARRCGSPAAARRRRCASPQSTRVHQLRRAPPDDFMHKSEILRGHCRGRRAPVSSEITRSANYNVVIGDHEADVDDRSRGSTSTYRRTIPELAAGVAEEFRHGYPRRHAGADRREAAGAPGDARASTTPSPTAPRPPTTAPASSCSSPRGRPRAALTYRPIRAAGGPAARGPSARDDEGCDRTSRPLGPASDRRRDASPLDARRRPVPVPCAADDRRGLPRLERLAAARLFSRTSALCPAWAHRRRRPATTASARSMSVSRAGRSSTTLPALRDQQARRGDRAVEVPCRTDRGDQRVRASESAVGEVAHEPVTAASARSPRRPCSRRRSRGHRSERSCPRARPPAPDGERERARPADAIVDHGRHASESTAGDSPNPARLSRYLTGARVDWSRSLAVEPTMTPTDGSARSACHAGCRPLATTRSRPGTRTR